MTTALDKSLLAVITTGGPWVDAQVERLKEAGAHVRICAPDATLWSILTALDYDAILIAMESGMRPIARALQEEPKLRSVPAVVLLEPGAKVEPGVGFTTIAATSLEEMVAAVELLVFARETTRRESIPPSAPSGAALKVPPVRRAIEAGFHDVRMLLGVVIGYGANLRDGADGELSDTQRANILKMMDAASDASVLLEHAITAGRTASLSIPAMDPIVKARSHLDLTALTHSVVRMFSKGAEHRKIDLVQVTNTPIWLWGNAVHLKQITANLISNALKFVPMGGRVRVTTRAVGSASAEIVVSDSGPGISPRDRERIFEYGVRLERDAAISGTGIGLAVVRELAVVHHGGSVRVDDAEEGGAEFVVALPLDQRLRARDATSTLTEPANRSRVGTPS